MINFFLILKIFKLFNEVINIIFSNTTPFKLSLINSTGPGHAFEVSIGVRQKDASTKTNPGSSHKKSK